MRVIHRPTKFAPTLGLTSNWDNEVFAFASDVGDGNQVTLIYWPDNSFTRTIQVCVLTVAIMEAQFDAAAGADCVGPYAAGDADTEELQTRLMFPVLPPYAEFVMQWQTFTPRQLWSDLVSLVIADGRAADCSLLINWAHVACTYQPAAQANAVPQQPATSAVVLTTPVADHPLQARVWEWLSSDLPTLTACWLYDCCL